MANPVMWKTIKSLEALTCAAIFCKALLGTVESHAQETQKSNPLDNVPVKIPFDVPYGGPILLDRSEIAITSALAEAKKYDWKMNIAVVDSDGNVVAFKRMDGARLASIQIAGYKAFAAVNFLSETTFYVNAIQTKGYLNVTTVDGIIASRGGIPPVEKGKII